MSRALAAVRKTMAERIVATLGKDPELLAQMTETGVLRREWVEAPGSGPISDATPLEVLERTLAGMVEKRPSVLASLGLSAIEVLSTSTDGEAADAVSFLTVCFTDLENFTRYTARAGDAAAARLLSEHYKTAGPIVRSRGGKVVKRLGDGLMMTFPEPTAAVLAAVELCEHAPEGLKVRAGLHVGEVIVGHSDVLGHVVNIAARVTETASGGEVLISHDLRALLPLHELPQIKVGRARARRLKGVGERIEVSPVGRA
ncbi:MAG: adenylate cyclase [Frankiales bacterium]|jgi:adenylate cyclase|nr:adenylate cyclase [Frankiales bacterium]